MTKHEYLWLGGEGSSVLYIHNRAIKVEVSPDGKWLVRHEVHNSETGPRWVPDEGSEGFDSAVQAKRYVESLVDSMAVPEEPEPTLDGIFEEMVEGMRDDPNLPDEVRSLMQESSLLRVFKGFYYFGVRAALEGTFDLDDCRDQVRDWWRSETADDHPDPPAAERI